MKVTFPHCGSAWVPLKALFDKNGIECIVPPPTSKRTISLGAKYSPEWVCLPFKVLLGNFIEGLELGADTLINIGGANLCRLGYYAKLHEQILKELGYKFDMVVFDWQDGAAVALVQFIRRMLGESKSLRELLGDIKFGIQQLKLMEDVEKRVHFLRPRETKPGMANKLWRAAGPRVNTAHSPAALKSVRKELMTELDAIPFNTEAKPLHVGFLGEFFMVMDPFCNGDLEEELGKRGVQIDRSAWLTDWVKIWLVLEMLGISHGRKVKKAANPYLSRDVSGDAIHSLGETVLHKKDGFDGIIHVMPFTCMPEIIAQNIFPNVTKDHEIPVMSIILDEQMGRAGLQTRIEAFVDLMERRRNRLAAS